MKKVWIILTIAPAVCLCGVFAACNGADSATDGANQSHTTDDGAPSGEGDPPSRHAALALF